MVCKTIHHRFDSGRRVHWTGSPIWQRRKPEALVSVGSIPTLSTMGLYAKWQSDRSQEAVIL